MNVVNTIERIYDSMDENMNGISEFNGAEPAAPAIETAYARVPESAPEVPSPCAAQPPREVCPEALPTQPRPVEKAAETRIFGMKLGGYGKFLIVSAATYLWITLLFACAVFMVISSVYVYRLFNPQIQPLPSQSQQGPDYGDGNGKGFTIPDNPGAGGDDGIIIPGNDRADDSRPLTAGFGITVMEDQSGGGLYDFEGGLVIIEMNEVNAFSGTDVAVNDIITAVNGQKVITFGELRAFLVGKNPGDELTVTVTRFKQGTPASKDYTVKLIELNAAD